MLSILIPVYNFPVVPLVKALCDQGKKLTLEWEIRCYDDGSDAAWKMQNQSIRQFSNVHYKELPTNIGRSAIRNLLAREAVGEYILFLDNDSGIIRNDFLQRYVSHLPSQEVLYGGRIYAAKQPEKSEYLLHWTYGHQRESLAVGQRKKRVYQSFMTNNFCLLRTLYLEVGLDEQIKTYGHEDTLFGLWLKQKSINIRHIDNPVIHLGLEDANTFLSKQKEAIANLIRLQDQYPAFSTRLTQFAAQLKQWKLATVAGMILNKMLPQLEQNLLGPQPNMHYFNLWKLHFYLRSLDNPIPESQ